MNKRQRIKVQRRQPNPARRMISWLAGVGGGLVLIALIVILVQASQGLMGDEVAIDSRDHVPQDTQPGPYASNPPAGGRHFPSTFSAGFYQESDLVTLPQYPEGYLVHNLEHGYVIFWYNCAVDPSLDCAELKQTIRSVMDRFKGVKLIAFPWSSMTDVPLTLTSWGRIQRFSTPDAEAMALFVERNRYKAPEPNGQ